MEKADENKSKELMAAVFFLLDGRPYDEVMAVVSYILSITPARGLYISPTTLRELQGYMNRANEKISMALDTMDGQSPLGASAQAANRDRLRGASSNLEVAVAVLLNGTPAGRPTNQKRKGP